MSFILFTLTNTIMFDNSDSMDFCCLYIIFESLFNEGLSVYPLLRSAVEQKKAQEENEFGAIDYDAPIESDKKTIGLGTKVNML